MQLLSSSHYPTACELFEALFYEAAIHMVSAKACSGQLEEEKQLSQKK